MEKQIEKIRVFGMINLDESGIGIINISPDEDKPLNLKDGQKIQITTK